MRLKCTLGSTSTNALGTAYGYRLRYQYQTQYQESRKHVTGVAADSTTTRFQCMLDTANRGNENQLRSKGLIQCVLVLCIRGGEFRSKKLGTRLLRMLCCAYLVLLSCEQLHTTTRVLMRDYPIRLRQRLLTASFAGSY